MVKEIRMTQNLTLDLVTAKGGFSTAGLVRKVVKWGEGNEAIVWVRPHSFAIIANNYADMEHGERVARNIAASICNEDGSPIFSWKDITGEAVEGRGALCEELVLELVLAIGQVNQKKTSSTPKTNSGVNSFSQESADEQSQKQKKE